MGINWGGLGLGYMGAQAEIRRQADDERRAQDEQFQGEARDRTRKEWTEQDRVRNADRKDIADVNAEFDAKRQQQQQQAGITGQDVEAAQQQVAADKTQAAIDAALAAPADTLPGVAKPAPKYTARPAVDTSVSPKLDPAVAAKLQLNAAGMPSAHNFNDALDRQAEILRRKAARGDLAPDDFAQKTGALQRMRDEGIHDALSLMAQGRYDDALERYNSVGAMRGATLVNGEQGTTKINGQDVPTHIVTIRNADGTRTVMDVAKAQFQMMDLNNQLQHADRARQLDMQGQQHTDSMALSREQMAQQAREAAASRALQAQHLTLARMQFDASTPFGRIAATEKALGSSLNPGQRAAILGVDTIRPEVRAQLNSLLKQQEGIETAINKAQADGTWQPDAVGAKELQTRSAIINQQVADLLGKQGGTVAATGVDPLGFGGKTGALAPASGAGGAGARPVAAPPAAPRAGAAPASPLFQPAAGVRPAPSAEVQAAPGSQAAIAQAIGLTNDGSMNAIVMQQADAIARANTEFKLALRTYQAVANSGDQAATKKALNDYYAANDALRTALDRVGNQRPAVEAAIGI